MGSDSVGQIFLGIVVCAFWLVILVHLKPYKSEWDNFVAITLAANLVLTIVSGMALKLYKATPGQSENQQVGFGFVLIGVSTICIILSIGTTLASIPYVQKRVEKCRKDRQERKTKKLSKEKNNDKDDNGAMPFKNPMHGKGVEMVKIREFGKKQKFKKLFALLEDNHSEVKSVDSFNTFLKDNNYDTDENMEKVEHLIQFLTNENLIIFDEFVALCEALNIKNINVMKYESKKQTEEKIKRLRRLSVMQEKRKVMRKQLSINSSKGKIVLSNKKGSSGNNRRKKV
eukprot:g11352.t1